MKPFSRWSIALALSLSIIVHGILLFTWNHLSPSYFSLRTNIPNLNTNEKVHWIIIQDSLPPDTRNPSDDDFVWSSQDHFSPKQKKHRFAQALPSSGISVKLKNIFEIPTQSTSAGIDGDDPQNVLNSRKYKHYSFFKRIFDKLYPTWTSELYYRSDQWNNHSEGSYLSRIRFRMDHLGYLTQMDLMLSSNAKPVDEAALVALRRSQPFPNPPGDFWVGEDEYEFVCDFLFELNKSGPLLNLLALPLHQ